MVDISGDGSTVKLGSLGGIEPLRYLQTLAFIVNGCTVTINPLLDSEPLILQFLPVDPMLARACKK